MHPELVEGLHAGFDRLSSHRLTQPASTDSAHIDSKRSPAYPKELTYPCCRQALGELGELSPHEGPENESTGSVGSR